MKKLFLSPKIRTFLMYICIVLLLACSDRVNDTSIQNLCEILASIIGVLLLLLFAKHILKPTLKKQQS